MEKHEKTAETKANEKMKRSKSESSLETKNCVELKFFDEKKNYSYQLIEEDERNRQERKLEELNEGTFKYYINS